MNKNKILIGCSAVLAVFFVIAAVAVYHVYRQIRRFQALTHIETPTELRELRVLVGQDRFEKTSFLQARELRRIGTIAYGQFHAGQEPELCVVGQTGALFLDGQGNQIESVTFDKKVEKILGLNLEETDLRIGQIDVVDVDGDQTYEFLMHNGFSHGAELISHDGKSLWTYDESEKGKSFLLDLAGGDIDGDGKAEYVAAYVNGKGLVLLDHSLKEIWSKPEVAASTVEMVDTDGSGKMKILHDNHGQSLSLRDAAGNVIGGGETDHYISRFSLVRWPSKRDRQYVVDFSDEVIRLMDFNGKTAKAFKAPLGKARYYMHAVPVKLNPNELEYFAAIVEFSGYKRSMLYVYNSTGDLVYQELLPAEYESIAAFPIEQTGQESILLGGPGEVIQYKMNIAPQVAPAH